MTNELIEQAKSGDQDACTSLYKHSIVYARFVVARMLYKAHPNDIDETAHETAVRALMHLDRFDGRSSYRTWLHRIAVNTALMIIRRPNIMRSLEVEDEEGILTTMEIPFTDKRFGQLEARFDLEKILSGLSSKVRTPIMLCALEGWSGEEMASELGTTLSGIKTRLFRGMKLARESMDDNNKAQARCVDCEKIGRFRFADTKVGDDPLCRWCVTDRQVTASRPAIREKKCDCGASFIPRSPNQKYCETCRPPKQIVHSPVTQQIELQRTHSSEMVTVTIPVSIIDMMWSSLSPEKKARAFEFVMKE